MSADHIQPPLERAPRAESDAPGVLVHTGFWGWGAFGGNRTLMPMLQAFAAEPARVDIAFHAFDEAGIATVEGALDTYRELRGGTPDTRALLDAIEEQQFEWGVSDGN